MTTKEDLKITEAEFLSLFDDSITKKGYDEIIGRITARVDQIVRQIAIRSDRMRFWWDFNNCDYDSEESGGYFDPKEYREYVGVGGEHFRLPEPYDDGFPTRWLWEDFEEELKKEVAQQEARAKAEKEHKKQVLQNRKQKLLDLQASIRTKLTKEELRAISFKK